MNALFVTVRAVHFASVILLFGELVFVLCVAKPLWRVARDAILDRSDVSRWPVRIALWSLAASIVSGAAWLVIEAAGMSGMPLAQPMKRATVGLVLGPAVFGRGRVRFGTAGSALGRVLIPI